MTAKNTLWLRTAGFTLVIGALIVLGAFVARPWIYDAHGAERGQGNGESTQTEDEEGSSAIPVQVILPKLDPNLSVSVTQPAYVLPYYQIDLRARVAGPVLSVNKTIGDRVVSGEDLIHISVPDLVQDVARKAAIVKQREQELEVSKAWLKKFEADVQIALSTVKEKESDIRAKDAITAFRKQELERFRGMARDGTVTGNIVAERKKFADAAEADGETAQAAVDRAKAEVIGARAKLLEGIADENLKESLIQVAKEDLVLARELEKFGTLRAPFDGVITRRNVDPGSFVQNSATGAPGPGLLTIEKMDIVTVYMNLPDNYAPYIDDKTEAVIEMSELPSVKIHALVTRFSPSLQTPGNDRTMRVEVDLYNRGPKTYEEFLAREKATQYADLKGGKLPAFPEVSEKLREKLGIKRLMPGMYGNMKLILHKFENAYLIPSQAIFSKGGKPFIFLVQDDVARRVAVNVQVDDGVTAKVVLLQYIGRIEHRSELTGNEKIVLSNQGELSDGQRVVPNVEKW